MRYLAEAVYTRLAGLYGQENVFHGLATEADVPYVEFVIDAAGEPEEHTGHRLNGHIFEYPVRIMVFANSHAVAANRVDEIMESFLTSEPTLGIDYLQRVTVNSHEVFMEPSREQDGSTVWRGNVILEFRVNKNQALA